MSPFYRDFIPHVYINEKKVWQKYVGMIKCYSKKLAFILIDKNNNLNINEIETSGNDPDRIVIRICFKNNIENSSDSNTNILNLTGDDDNTIFTS